MNIAIDIDGVLRNFADSLVRIYKQDYPDHEVKPITTWNFADSFPIGEEIYQYYVRNGERIFSEALPYDGAYEFIQSLKSLGHSVVYLTAQPFGLNAVTTRWIEKHLPEVDGIILSKKKHLFSFDILLDDAPHNIRDCIKNGKTAVFFTQKWNEGIEHTRVNSYKEFLELIVDMETIGELI